MTELINNTRSLDQKVENRNKVWFDSSFRRYYQALCYFAIRYLKDRVAAEDVVQGVFVRLLDEGNKFEGELHLKHYLYKSVRYACLNEIKLSAIHSNILKKVGERTLEREEENFLTEVIQAELFRKIQEALEELPTECGRIFRMAYLEHLDNSEIAEQLHISINTVKVQKNKAKHLLRKKLQGLYPLVFLFIIS